MVIVTIVAAVFAAATASAAASDQAYDVAGMDSYRIGTATPPTEIAYSGTQQLVVGRVGAHMRFSAEARYTRTQGSIKANAHAQFIQELTSGGSFEDRSDNDPDFLTILNQPFAVQLDRTTLHDLRALHGSVPFQASSPLGSSTLHGLLRRNGSGGEVNGHPVIGVRFEAAGPMSGPLPEHDEANITGTIRMNGIAYYALDSALLLALDATLTITGNLHDDHSVAPVHITYRRTIRANDTIPTEAQSPRS